MRSLMLCLLMGNLFSQTHVQIESIPSGASLIIDGKIIGVTPQFQLQLTPGVHSFELSKENHVPVKWKTSIQDAPKVELGFRLSPIYKVQFVSKEKNLQFRLNNDRVWSDKKATLFLENGEHELQVYQGGEMVDEKVIYIQEPTKIVYEYE